MLNKIERTKAEDNSRHSSNSCIFIEAYPTDESEANIDELKKWVKSISLHKKRVRESNRLDIRKHLLLASII